MAGAPAQFRRERLHELCITYDLAFDRLVYHGRMVEFTGASHRMENALMLGKQSEDDAR